MANLTEASDDIEHKEPTRILLSDGGEIDLEELKHRPTRIVGEDWSDSPTGGPTYIERCCDEH